MADLGKDLLLSRGKVPPQFLDESTGEFKVATGENGAAFYRARGSIGMESWTDANPILTYPSERYGFSVVNDGTADLSFVINGNTRTVKPGEGYSALFEPFTSLTINATSAYRAEVLR